MYDYTPRRSVLLCLDLQEEHADAHSHSDAAAVVAAIAVVISEARRQGWPVFHIHARPADNHLRRHAIPGLEPRQNEPVFLKAKYSALRSEVILQALREERAEIIYAIGFALALDYVATAYDAAELGLPLTYIAEAMGSAAATDYSSPPLRELVRTVLHPLVEITDLATFVRNHRSAGIGE